MREFTSGKLPLPVTFDEPRECGAGGDLPNTIRSCVSSWNIEKLVGQIQEKAFLPIIFNLLQDQSNEAVPVQWIKHGL